MRWALDSRMESGLEPGQMTLCSEVGRKSELARDTLTHTLHSVTRSSFLHPCAQCGVFYFLVLRCLHIFIYVWLIGS